jgi:hypothetical protein
LVFKKLQNFHFKAISDLGSKQVYENSSDLEKWDFLISYS